MHKGEIIAFPINKIKEGKLWKKVYTLGQLDEMKHSILMHGQLGPGIMKPDGVLISGHRRLNALRELGMDTMDIVIKDVPDEQEAFLMIHSNQQRIKTYRELTQEATFLLEELGNCQGKRRDILVGAFPDNEIEKKLRGRDKYEVIAEAIGFPHSGATLRRMMNVEKTAQEHPDDSVINDIHTKMLDKKLHIAQAERLVKDYHDIKEGLVVKAPLRILQSPIISYQHILGCSCHLPLDDKSVQCTITSPPYWRLRDYKGVIGFACPHCADQLGHEKNHFHFIKNLTEKYFTEVFRVLKDTGSLFINFGETYDKDTSLLIGYRLILELCDKFGWHLVNEIIWKKTNPKPQGNNRRMLPSYEKIFHLVKQGQEYDYYPQYTKTKEGIALKMGVAHRPWKGDKKEPNHCITKPYKKIGDFLCKQDVHDIVVGSVANHAALKTIENSIDHPAMFPLYLPVVPILTTTKPGDLILDPFSGTGTTGVASLLLGRNYVGVEKISEYHQAGEDLLKNTLSLVNTQDLEYIESLFKNMN